MPAGGAAGAKRASSTRSANLRHQAEQHLVEHLGHRGAGTALSGRRGAGRTFRAASPVSPFKRMDTAMLSESRAVRAFAKGRIPGRLMHKLQKRAQQKWDRAHRESYQPLSRAEQAYSRE